MRTKKTKLVGLAMILAMILSGFIMKNVRAAQVITEEKPVTTIRMVQEVVKTADNFIVLFDASGSMQNPYKDTNMKKVEVAEKIFKERNDLLPDLDWNAGLYLYTPWKTFYQMQPYEKESFGKALDELVAYKPSLSYKNQPTPLGNAIKNLDPILAKVSGHTSIFIFSDGQYTLSQPKIWPVPAAREIASKHDVSFYLISSAETPKSKKLLADISSANASSWVVPFDVMLKRPEYTFGGLYTVKDTAIQETEMVSKVVGVDLDNILFDFDKTDIRPEYHDELNALGKFLQDQPKAYVVIEGFTDKVGDVAYNMYLSRERAEKVRDYLMENFNIDQDRFVVTWYGKVVPAASDDTAEGRSMNRRVRVLLRGLN